MDHVRHERYEPAGMAEIARDLAVPEAEMAEFEGALEGLVKSKTLVRDSAGRMSLPRMPSEVIGKFKKNPRGFGFVVPEGAFREGDVFIPPPAVGDALTGDTVRVAVSVSMRGGQKDVSGEIIEVVKRRRTVFAGELVQRGGMWLVMPDGRELTQPIRVDDPSVKNARAGDKVTIEITTYPDGGMAGGGGGGEFGEGVITSVLGEAGLPDVETQAVIAAYSLPGEFPKSCVDQAREAAKRFEVEVKEGDRKGWSPHERLDLREQYIITIDPNDSKDFDDAISIEVNADGWYLGVHIADVAHFIPPGSPLDVEARERGNSVYLPRLVIPMLPEVLSNGICSLSEGTPRFCKSAFMSYSHEGEILEEKVAATIIKSAKRLTYREAQALIDGDLKEARKHARTETKYTDQLVKTLREMDKLAKVIRARRKREGMIHLELPTVELVYDDAGHVVDAVPEDDSFTHTLIEMFMVEANEVLARLFEGMDVPLLRRIHPEPPPGDVSDLRQTAKVAGFNVPKNPTRQDLQALLDATAGTPAARVVHFAVLRTLTKAEYSPALVGHFALASDAYAHFTSPIRRYADLTVHRALAAYLFQTDNGKKRPKNERERKRMGGVLRDLGEKHGVLEQDELVEIGRHITQTEENAEGAEQNLRSFLLLQLMMNHLGETFEGVVTGVTNTGVFVQLDKYLAEGMIKSTDLPGGGGGRWFVDQRSGALTNQGTGKAFSMGNRVKVVIARVDLALRKMDLLIADPSTRRPDGAKGGGQQQGQHKKKPGKPEPARAAAGDDFFHHNRLTGSKRRSMRSKGRDKGKPGHAGGAAGSGGSGGGGNSSGGRGGGRRGGGGGRFRGGKGGRGRR